MEKLFSFDEREFLKKYAFSEISLHTRNVNVLPRDLQVCIHPSIRETPIPHLELSKNIIDSRAENLV